MKTLVFDRQALKNNIAVVRDRAGSSVIYGMLSGDGYGAGTAELGQILRSEGIARFAVSEVSEAVALRKSGLVEAEILMLRTVNDREELEQLIDLNVVCTVSSTESGLALNSVAESRATVVEAHVQIDTGMGFGGFLTEETEKIFTLYRNLPNVAISGIYTQIQAKGGKGKESQEQLNQFHTAVESIQKAGFETGIVHAAGSYALLHYDFARMDGVRAGSVILGRCRRTHGDKLQKVGYGEVEIVDTRWATKGSTVGNEKLIKLRRPTRIAILPVGYQNGLGVTHSRDNGLWSTLRRWWGRKRMTMRIGGQRAKVIGCVGATETLVDITNIKCGVGDIAVFDIDPMYAKGFVRSYRNPAGNEEAIF